MLSNLVHIGHGILHFCCIDVYEKTQRHIFLSSESDVSFQGFQRVPQRKSLLKNIFWPNAFENDVISRFFKRWPFPRMKERISFY